jgi:hypothetical protein
VRSNPEKPGASTQEILGRVGKATKAAE